MLKNVMRKKRRRRGGGGRRCSLLRCVLTRPGSRGVKCLTGRVSAENHNTTTNPIVEVDEAVLLSNVKDERGVLFQVEKLGKAQERYEEAVFTGGWSHRYNYKRGGLEDRAQR